MHCTLQYGCDMDAAYYFETQAYINVTKRDKVTSMTLSPFTVGCMQIRGKCQHLIKRLFIVVAMSLPVVPSEVVVTGVGVVTGVAVVAGASVVVVAGVAAVVGVAVITGDATVMLNTGPGSTEPPEFW